MFKTEVQDVSFGVWLIQQVGVVLVTAAWALVTANMPADLELMLGQRLAHIIETIWYVVFVWGVGLLVALLVYRFVPRAAASGCWVWPLPAFFWLLCFAGLAVMRSFQYALASFFSPGPNAEAEWGVAIVTYPTCQCLLYSLGMFFRSHTSRQHRASLPLSAVENGPDSERGSQQYPR